jgi:hypothetical protein
VILLSAVLALAGCSADEGAASGQSPNTTLTGQVGTPVTVGNGAGSYIDISPDELAGMLESKDFLLIQHSHPVRGRDRAD